MSVHMLSCLAMSSDEAERRLATVIFIFLRNLEQWFNFQKGPNLESIIRHISEDAPLPTKKVQCFCSEGYFQSYSFSQLQGKVSLSVWVAKRLNYVASNFGLCCPAGCDQDIGGSLFEDVARYSSLCRGLTVELEAQGCGQPSVCGSETTAERIHIGCTTACALSCAVWDFDRELLILMVGARPYYTKRHSVGALYARGHLVCEKSLQDRSRIQWSLLFRSRASFIRDQSSQ